MSSQENQQRKLERGEGNEISSPEDGKTTSKGQPDKHQDAGSYHKIRRTWLTTDVTAEEQKPIQSASSCGLTPMEEWAQQSSREQPWNALGHVRPLPPAKEKDVVRGEVNSNSAVAGSDAPDSHD